MATDYSQLNKAQLDAVNCTEGAVLVLAGAGSGKTRVLTHRVCHIVEEGLARGWEILAVTFTNKAAAEMKSRIAKMLGEDCDVWVSTIHSFCTTVLRKYIKLLGYGSNFSIYSENDRDRIIKRILREKHVDNLTEDIGEIISNAKSANIGVADFIDKMPPSENSELFRDVYEAYEEAMKSNNALDFDDLLIKVKDLFEQFPEALSYYQNKLKYIHVDEFQDTNEIQMQIIKMLAAGHGNIFVVGDDDQSIYGWRGANIENILHFDESYPDAKIFKLEQNYRSTPEILNVANNVIRHNVSRHDKTLFTENRAGAKVEFYPVYNDRQEAEWVVDTIRGLKYYNGYRDSDIAILVRNNSLTRAFEQKLYSSNIDYKVYGGFKFFDRKEILDVLAYLRVMVNPSDDEAIERVINIPRRAIGETSVEKLTSYAKAHNKDLFDVISSVASYGIVNSGTAKHIEEFYELLSDLLAKKQDMPLADFVKYTVESVGFEGMYNNGSDKEEDYNRWLNIQDFVTYVKEYTQINRTADLEEFIASCTLVATGDIDSGDFVTIATIHAVKGLEFPIVFLVACEETILPSAMAIKEQADAGLEEERRLMYVAATRARDRLYVSYTSQRFRYGQIKPSIPSRFIQEAKGEQAQAKIKLPPQVAKLAAYETKTEVYTVAAPVAKSADDIKKFVSGVTVTHPRYGDGTVVVVDRDTVTVLFKGAGVKKFVLSTAPLSVK